MNDEAIPPSTRPWLEELEASFRKRAEQELLFEADREVNDLMVMIDDPGAPERLWVIETLLKQRKIGELQRLFRLLDKEELRAVLERLRVPEEQIEEILEKVVD